MCVLILKDIAPIATQSKGNKVSQIVSPEASIRASPF